MMRRDFITLNAYGPRGRGAAAGGTGTAASEVAGHRVLGFGVPKTRPCGPIWIPPLSSRWPPSRADAEATPRAPRTTTDSTVNDSLQRILTSISARLLYLDADCCHVAL